MTTTQIRKAVHKKIDQIDDQFLNVVHAMLEAYSNGNDYTRPGKPMSLQAYKKRIRQSKAQYARGEFISQEELEKEVAGW
ncbi:MAG: hypothetical protein AAB209_14505 [Bacteroidota bacterium]|mgnify:CR=1 FL=1